MSNNRKNAGSHHRPARKIVRRGHSSFVGRFPSAKSSISLECESTYERDYLCLCESDPEISEIVGQPETLFWDDDGTRRRHVPDYLVVRGGGVEIVEIKPLKRANDDAIQRRTRILKEQLAAEGRTYVLLTEKDIRVEPRLSNAKLLLNGRGQMPSPELRANILFLLNDVTIPIDALVRALGQPPNFVNAIYALILAGDLELADRSQPLTWTSHIKKRGS